MITSHIMLNESFKFSNCKEALFDSKFGLCIKRVYKKKYDKEEKKLSNIAS